VAHLPRAESVRLAITTMEALQYLMPREGSHGRWPVAPFIPSNQRLPFPVILPVTRRMHRRSRSAHRKMSHETVPVTHGARQPFCLSRAPEKGSFSLMTGWAGFAESPVRSGCPANSQSLSAPVTYRFRQHRAAHP
jgi:hypothetical protein